MQPGTGIASTEDQLQIIYREWGVFYTHKQKLDIAAKYYDTSLELKDDPKAFYQRSCCKRSIAQTRGALQDAKAAMASDPLSQPYNLEVCDGLYELNNFEEAKCEIFNNSLKFKGIKLRAFNNRSDVITDNFGATIGNTLDSFILENEKYFFKAFNQFHRSEFVDRRPLWKILKEQEKCDVLSVLEEEEELICPREIARRKRAFDVFNQMYMRRSWMDVVFLKELKSNPSLLLPQSKWSSPLLEQCMQTKYDATIRFLRMLHARSPIYTQKVRKCPDKNLAKKQSEAYLFRIQYQVHRNMLHILKRIKYLRQVKQLEKLARYVEEVMGDYVVLKTNRVMPWKFEFLNEVYNLLALAHIDDYVDASIIITDYKQEDRLNILLQMPLEKDKEVSAFIFGDKSLYQDATAADMFALRHKKFIARMEKRMIFAKNPIEKAYIWHEIARSHLKNTRFDECCIIARRAIEEAKKCNSLVWTLLGQLMVCKSHAVMRKIEKIHDTLTDARQIAMNLKNAKILRYIERLLLVNSQDAQEKKSLEEFRRNKSRNSMQYSGRNSSVGS